VATGDPARLQRVVRNKVVESHDLDGRTVLGRSKDADLLLVDPSVSREHAVVLREGERWIIEDLGSANGILVNETKTERAVLNEGDIVTIGDAVLLFTRTGVAVDPEVAVTLSAPDDAAEGQPWEGAVDVALTFAAEESIIDAAGDAAKRMLGASCLSENELHYMHWAVMEALSNAFRHGSNRDRGRAIELRLVRQDARVMARVGDQGPGFDFEQRWRVAHTGDAIGAARNRFEEGGVGGLGIMLMVKCVDLVEFNERGNVLTLTKCPGDVFNTRTIYGGLGFEEEAPPELPSLPDRPWIRT
jgi:anti-sigma regulatory factor (Ser/Thr protein kinase)